MSLFSFESDIDISMRGDKVIINGISYDRSLIQVKINPRSLTVQGLEARRYSRWAEVVLSDEQTETPDFEDITFFEYCTASLIVNRHNIERLLEIQRNHPTHPFTVLLACDGNLVVFFQIDPAGEYTFEDIQQYKTSDSNDIGCARCVKFHQLKDLTKQLLDKLREEDARKKRVKEELKQRFVAML